MGDNAGKCPFQLSDIAGDFMRKEFQHLIGHRPAAQLITGLQNRIAQFKIRRMNISHHTTAHTRAQTLANTRQIMW